MSEWGDSWGTPWGCPKDGTGDPDDDQPFPRTIADVCKFWLWWQYDRAENMQKLCAIFTVIFGELDDRAQQILNTRGLDGATGTELDAWGVMVNILRNGVDDNLMRRKIRAAARAALGQGQPRDFFDVLTLIAPDSNPRFAEVWPACVRLFFNAISLEEQKILFELMKQVPGLGICISYIEIDPSGQVFEFSYLESDVGIVPRVTFPITWHWDFFPDKDIPPNQKAGFAFLIE